MKSAVYLFYGEEDFLIDERISELKSKIDNPSLNVETLDGENLSPETLSAALRTAPMFGGEKLVIIRNLEIDPESRGDLVSPIKNVPPGVKVVFQASSVDKRSKFYKQVDKQGEVIEFKAFAPWELEELISWIKSCVRRSGKRISDEGARLLQEVCGNNLRLLANEIEKLITFIGEREEIKEDDVSTLASSGEKTVFDLLDALRKKNLKKSLLLFQILRKNKEDLFQLLSTVATQYRLMLQIKSLPGNDPLRIAKTVGASPFFVRKCLEGINRFTSPELKRNLETMLETNLRLKTGESQTVVFEMLLTSLCGA